MESSKRHSLLSLIFILNCFSKTSDNKWAWSLEKEVAISSQPASGRGGGGLFPYISYWYACAAPWGGVSVPASAGDLRLSWKSPCHWISEDCGLTFKHHIRLLCLSVVAQTSKSTCRHRGTFVGRSKLIKCLSSFFVCLSVWLVVAAFCSIISTLVNTVEPRFNEPLFNEVLDITNDILCPSQSYSKMHGIEPRYNEFFDIANVIRKPKRKIYLDITNYNVNTRQKINAEQINSHQIL